jgi:hypothetical protein
VYDAIGLSNARNSRLSIFEDVSGRDKTSIGIENNVTEVRTSGMARDLIISVFVIK